MRKFEMAIITILILHLSRLSKVTMVSKTSWLTTTTAPVPKTPKNKVCYFPIPPSIPLFSVDLSTPENHEEVAVPREVLTNPTPSKKMKKSVGDDYQLLVNTDDVYFWALNDSKTLVMYLDTMLPETTLETYKVINEGIEMAAELGLSQLIVCFFPFFFFFFFFFLA